MALVCRDSKDEITALRIHIHKSGDHHFLWFTKGGVQC